MGDNQAVDWGLQGAKVLITGASSGLGAEFARYFADAGSVVALAARRTDRLDAIAAGIRDKAGIAIPIAMDVTDVDSIKRGVEQAQDLVGPIDVLVNNAGLSCFEDAFDGDADAWDRVQATNLKGPWVLSAEVAKRMRSDGRMGAIVNIASVAGLRQWPFMASYCTSKAALIQLTSCLSREFAPFGIRVNAIAPGMIDAGVTGDFPQTAAGRAMLKRIPLGRLGAVEDLRFAVLWLASRHASYVTGSCIVIDGGLMQS